MAVAVKLTQIAYAIWCAFGRERASVIRSYAKIEARYVDVMGVRNTK